MFSATYIPKTGGLNIAFATKYQLGDLVYRVSEPELGLCRIGGIRVQADLDENEFGSPTNYGIFYALVDTLRDETLPGGPDAEEDLVSSQGLPDLIRTLQTLLDHGCYDDQAARRLRANLAVMKEYTAWTE